MLAMEKFVTIMFPQLSFSPNPFIADKNSEFQP